MAAHDRDLTNARFARTASILAVFTLGSRRALFAEATPDLEESVTPAKRSRNAHALDLYWSKRDFELTSEPRGTKASGARWSYVVQQHDARRMHYDFRLELDGVLLSWAIPKGPSLDPKDRRLAVQTEDHPVTYREFEGKIPPGQYGSGAVIVWDRGIWSPEGDPRSALDEGRLSFSLDGEKLQGRFSLIRLRGAVSKGPKSQWLLLKRTDEHARSGAAARVTSRQPQSVISGRTVAEVEAAAPARRGTKKTPKAAAQSGGRARKTAESRMPALGDIDPQLATLVDRPPAGDDWIYEVKFDGYRLLAGIVDGKVQLRSRNNLDWTRTLPSISQALGRLKLKQAVIDGELCYLDEQGRSSFQKLQNALPRGLGKRAETSRLYYYVFDILFHDGIDVRDQPLLHRKQRLQRALGKRPPARIRYSDHLVADGRTALLHACSSGLEGLIAKRGGAPYRGKRSRDWLKLKCQQRQEFVIVGMIRATRGREGFRSLVLGTRSGKQLKYAGRVGTGFSAASIRELSALLDQRVIDHAALPEHPPLAGVVWVKPDLVCEVAYTEITQDGALRHPSFQGLRRDKPASQVRLEEPVAAADTRERTGTDPDAVGSVRITHAERVMDAQSGATKGQLARYHRDVADWFMPYASRRPLALVRCPQGDAQQCFFQKHRMPGVGPHVRRKKIGNHEVLYVDEHTGILELVQFNAIEFHAWGASIGDPRRPDWLVMDLDPDASLKFADVADAALEVRDVLAAIKLRSWVRTTGGKGLHVCVPLVPQNEWKTVKNFTKAVAQTLEQRNPGRYVASMSKAKRVGRIFVDYLRNGEGATAVLPYSPRTRPGMTVAMPIDWRDVRRIDPREFDLASVSRWLKRRRRDPWKDFLATPQTLPGS